MFFTMLREELIHLKDSLVIINETYESFSELWWEAHLIAWFLLVVEVGTTLQEGEYSV